MSIPPAHKRSVRSVQRVARTSPPSVRSIRCPPSVRLSRPCVSIPLVARPSVPSSPLAARFNRPSAPTARPSVRRSPPDAPSSRLSARKARPSARWSRPSVQNNRPSAPGCRPSVHESLPAAPQIRWFVLGPTRDYGLQIIPLNRRSTSDLRFSLAPGELSHEENQDRAATKIPEESKMLRVIIIPVRKVADHA